VTDVAQPLSQNPEPQRGAKWWLPEEESDQGTWGKRAGQKRKGENATRTPG